MTLLLGDGAAGFSLMDVDTLVRHDLPVVMVMGNNSAWGLEKGPMQMIYGYDVAADLAQRTPYDEVVKALGGAGDPAVRATHACIVVEADADEVERWVREQRPDLRVMSAGRAIEVYKEVGRPEAFARQFGELTTAHPTVPAVDGAPNVLPVDSEEGRAANNWHTDVTFVLNPPQASTLRSLTIPPYGGTTMWANTVAAYEALPLALRALVDQLWAVHTNDYDYVADVEDPEGDGPERDALGGASPSVCLVNDAGLPTVCALVCVCAPWPDGERASANTDTLGGADADAASARGAWIDAERDELSSAMGAGAWIDAASPSARRKSSIGSLLDGTGLGATLGGAGAVSCCARGTGSFCGGGADSLGGEGETSLIGEGVISFCG